MNCDDAIDSGLRALARATISRSPRAASPALLRLLATRRHQRRRLVLLHRIALLALALVELLLLAAWFARPVAQAGIAPIWMVLLGAGLASIAFGIAAETPRLHAFSPRPGARAKP